MLNEETRKKVANIISKAKELGFSKIVICTNGVFVRDAYREAENIWNEAKKEILLKISVDTFKPERLKKISEVNDEYGLIGRIKKSISEMKEAGFSIELNTVITHYNLEELKEIYEYACAEKLVPFIYMPSSSLSLQYETNPSHLIVKLINPVAHELFL